MTKRFCLLPGDLRAEARAELPANDGESVVDGCDLQKGRVAPGGGLIRRRGLFRGLANQLRRGALLKDQWQSPVWPSVHRVYPHECDAFLRGRILPLAWKVICRRVCLALPGEAFLGPA